MAFNYEPFTFSIPGEEPDTSINLFGREVYAHSSVLKRHSEYFEKFMDKNNHPKGTDSHRYKYVTVIDQDGSWGLEKILPGQTRPSDRYSDENSTEEMEAFFRLLSAMYSVPYTLGNSDELFDMFRQADFYLALPIMSSTLAAALQASPPLIADNPPPVFIIAEVLQNRAVFQEAAIHLTAGWDADEVEPGEYDNHFPSLHLIRKAYLNLSAKIMKTELQITKHILDKISYRIGETTTTVSAHWTNMRSTDLVNRENLFLYYVGIRKECIEFVATHPGTCIESRCAAKWHSDIAEMISPLMENRLQFPVSDGPPEKFYFAEIADEDLPWAPTGRKLEFDRSLLD